MYPGEGLPALRIVAFQKGGNSYYYVDTAIGQSTYAIQNLPPGTYRVVAYVRPESGFPAGLGGRIFPDGAVRLKYGCNDHTLIDVEVQAGNTTTNVDPNDFYADRVRFPATRLPEALAIDKGSGNAFLVAVSLFTIERTFFPNRGAMTFQLEAPFRATGDQPEAISRLIEGVRQGFRHQVLLGATGTGKTFTIASVIEGLQMPALIMAHNKTLPRSFMRSSGSSSRETRWNILFRTRLLSTRSLCTQA